MSQTIRITVVATVSDSLLAKLNARAARGCREFAEMKGIAEVLSAMPGVPQLYPVVPDVEQFRDSLLVQQALNTAARSLGGLQAAYVKGDTAGCLERNRGFMRLTDDDSPSGLAVELADCDTDPLQFWNPAPTEQGARWLAEAAERQQAEAQRRQDAERELESFAATQFFGLEPITADTPDLDPDVAAVICELRPVDPAQQPLAGLPDPEPACVEAEATSYSDASSADCSAASGE